MCVAEQIAFVYRGVLQRCPTEVSYRGVLLEVILN